MNTCKPKAAKLDDTTTYPFERNGNQVSVSIQLSERTKRTISHAQFEKDWVVVNEEKGTE